MNQSFNEQKWWLSLYTQTFLSELQVGNALAVENKLKLLVVNGNLTQVNLKFGSTTLQAAKPANTEKTSKHPSLISQFLLPDNTAIIEVKDRSNSPWGTLSATLDREILIKPIQESLYSFFYFSTAFFLIFLGLMLIVVERRMRPLARLADYISGFTKSKSSPEEWKENLKSNLNFKTRELDLLHSEFNSAIKNLLELEEAAKKQGVQLEMSKIALQVAHDLGSPLSALSIATQDLSALPEANRVLIRAAVSRIRDITNLLLEKHRLSNGYALRTDSSLPTTELISSLVDSIVSEKRTQFRDKLNITIELAWDSSSYGAFASVTPVEFKSIVSNLVNNSIESLTNDRGTVAISFESSENQIILKFSDNGKGIPGHILPSLSQHGLSYGKELGSGLGLYQARTKIESWGGQLTIDSKLGVGTSITITLPRVNPPNWFVPSICFGDKISVVVLDDDISIHEIWRQRLTKASNRAIKLINFSTPAEIEGWVLNHQNEIQDSLFLVDYELLGESQNGIDLINSLNIAKQSILVTSHAEESQLQKRCAEIQLKIIPKSMAGLVPIL